MLLDIFHLGLEKARFANLFEIRRWHAKHYSKARDNVKRGLRIFFEQQLFPLFFLAAVFGHKLNFDWANLIFAALSLTLLRCLVPS